MQLLDRTREGPKLTDAGRVLVAHAEAAIARLDEAERELAAIAGLEGGELRLASFPSASATVLTEAVSIFHRRHPKVRLSVADAEPEESLPRLRAGELDLALTFDYPSVPNARRARPRPHPGADRVDAPGAAQGPRARRPRRSCRWPSSRRPSGSAARARAPAARSCFRACRDAGFEPRIGFESDDYHVMQGFIAAGLGVTLLPDLALTTLRSDLVVRATDPPAPQRRVWAATRAEGARSPATDEMLSILVEVGARVRRSGTGELTLVA